MDYGGRFKAKILIIGRTLSFGGTSRYTTNLIRELEKNKEVDFDFINLKSYYDLPGKYLKRLNLIRKFPQEIDIGKYDLIHFLQLDYSVYGMLRRLKKNTKRPKIIKTSHGMAKREENYKGLAGRFIQKPLISYIQKYVQKNADAMIYVSDEQREYFIKDFKLDRAKTYVVYLASSFESYKGDLHDLLANKERSILFVGRIERRKRIEEIFEVAKLMPDWQFKITGHVDDEGYYRELLKTRPENALFLTNISDEEIVAAYRKAKYFISFSKWENCPVTYLESVSQGTPVIAYSMPIHKMIENGCGYRVLTPSECVAKIEELEAVYDSIIEKTVSTSSLFTWEKTASETVWIYKDVLGIRE